MMKRQNFMMLAAAALLVSCSGDDALPQEAGSGEGLKTIILTATLPADGMVCSIYTAPGTDCKNIS